jgi:hypothetical protein
VLGAFEALPYYEYIHILIVPSGAYKWSINPVSNPYPVFSHTHNTWQYLIKRKPMLPSDETDENTSKKLKEYFSISEDNCKLMASIIPLKSVRHL